MNKHWITAASVATLLTACGGSDNNNDDKTTAITISGKTFVGETVSVQDANSNAIATAEVGSDGTYSVSLPEGTAAEDLVILSNDGAASAYIKAENVNAETKAYLTPASTIVTKLMLENNKENAAKLVHTAFGIGVDVSQGFVDATTENANASEDEKLNGLRVRAFSSLQNNVANATIANLTADLADDELLNGSTDELNADIQHQYISAFMAFKNSEENKTGLTNAQVGKIPFAKIAETDSYIVEYIAGEQAARQGQTDFSIKVTDKNGVVINDANIEFTPVMHMASMSHGAPQSHEAASFNEETQAYDKAVYYMMGSATDCGCSNGMGYWELKLSVNDEMLSLYPPVAGGGDDTQRVKLMGIEDKIPEMDMGSMNDNMEMKVTNRPYYIFNRGLTMHEDGKHMFSVFVAAEKSMSAYPAVFTNADLGHNLIANPVSVSFCGSQCDNEENWVMAMESEVEKGVFSAMNFAVDETDEGKTIQVKLTVNGETKTNNGKTVAENAEDRAYFKIGAAAMEMDHEMP